MVEFSVDECPRAGTTPEVLGKLSAVFKQGGSVTAGNSSPLNDGAAASVLLSDKKAAELGVKPLGRLRGFAVAGVDPDIMGIGPVPAIRKLLAQTGLAINDIDRFEINEAFAAQAVYCARELGISDERLNVTGGAILRVALIRHQHETSARQNGERFLVVIGFAPGAVFPQ